ncbi:hypothetical protein, partial [Enterobacter ludwigii]|uniref:hypothetical protein n=1 Tax=Enterobacter ludwigii TaxID=299767 RepID=UPI0039757195
QAAAIILRVSGGGIHGFSFRARDGRQKASVAGENAPDFQKSLIPEITAPLLIPVSFLGVKKAGECLQRPAGGFKACRVAE